MRNSNKRLKPQNLEVQLSTSAKNWLLKKGYDAQNGVRSLRRTLQDEIEDYLAEQLLKQTVSAGALVQVTIKAKKLDFNFVIKTPSNAKASLSQAWGGVPLA